MSHLFLEYYDNITPTLHRGFVFCNNYIRDKGSLPTGKQASASPQDDTACHFFATTDPTALI